MDIKERIRAYWTKRSKEFGDLRRRELESYMAKRWLDVLNQWIPERKCRILDVGTGTGFFALLLAKAGHEVVGIDLTESMIEEAKVQAKNIDQANFYVMDAESLDFPDESFDFVISRNVTWTLPHPEEAYREWYRVLKPKGTLINYDGDYGRVQYTTLAVPEHNAHNYLGQDTLAECDAIQQSLDISRYPRPAWDESVLGEIGFMTTEICLDFGNHMYKEEDEFYNPITLFSIVATK